MWKVGHDDRVPAYFEHDEVFERSDGREPLLSINMLHDKAPVHKSKKVHAALLECGF